jgi:hypothetical protein
MLFATGMLNFCGLLEYRCAVIIGLRCDIFVPGEFAVYLVAVMIALNKGPSLAGGRYSDTDDGDARKQTACFEEAGC